MTIIHGCKCLFFQVLDPEVRIAPPYHVRPHPLHEPAPGGGDPAGYPPLKLGPLALIEPGKTRRNEEIVQSFHGGG
ncbi:hypothetical protein [Thermosulfurimonas sp. F29]|uniref:hypothetical protein n=1 Tax=Thermosulfurimonas sp. F29 TaxID=2867247 RepID=UPI001C837C62|nr:hypothetical protein [Thermosulfurimonas sp. F29]MBX6423337.1 hypothetical protein [Thermosulfurimonas sp. F29]